MILMLVSLLLSMLASGVMIATSDSQTQGHSRSKAEKAIEIL